MFVMPILCVLLLWSSADATTRHVPVDYLTIQSALDSVQEGDTVLVDVGLYEEAPVVIPLVNLVLRGNVADTLGDYERPVIDPSSLSDPTHLSCLRQMVGNIVIEDMEFRNGAAMYPGRGDVAGGLDHPHNEIVLRRCVFDSTYNAVAAYQAIVTVSNCDFRNQSGWGIWSYQRVTAVNCAFQSNSVLWAQLTARAGSVIDGCHFSGNYGAGNAVLNLAPENIQVRNCVFGPGESTAGNRIFFLCSNSVFENNVITDWHYGSALIAVQTGVPGSILIRNNVMRNCSVRPDYPQAFLSGYDLWMQVACDTCAIYFENNVIENCSGQHGTPGVLVRGGTDYANHNRFTNVSRVAALNMGANWTLRDNLFYGNQVAMSGGGDAVWNWWGDPTGPACAQNPGGQGDSIEGGTFDPWYTDTLFFPDDSPEPNPPLPIALQLEVHPNPFNSTIGIELAGFTGQDFELTLHNLLGQIVDVVERGPVTGGALTYTAPPSLASGVYFLKASDSKAVVTRKVILMK